MSTGTALFLLLILACPLMMIFMMRGHGHGGGHGHGDASAASVDELRHRRDELHREIAAREDDSHYDSGRSSLAVSSPADIKRAAPETNCGPAPARR